MSLYLGSILPVGTIIHSMLSVAQFQTEYGGNWILADGSSVSGSKFHEVTGVPAVPDMRGLFLRGKNNGATYNPDGDLALGTFSEDKFESHNHPYNAYFSPGATSYTDYGYVANAATGSVLTTATAAAQGANETAPKSVTVNIFIRIN